MIYLASRSPRRRELLEQIGVRFQMLLFREGVRWDADTDEAVLPGEIPEDYVRRVALAKVRAAWKRVVMRRGLSHFPVLAADTTVALGTQILGKPANSDEARRILALLSGTEHRVLTAVAIALEDRCELAVSESRVYKAAPGRLWRGWREATPQWWAFRSTKPPACSANSELSYPDG